LSDVERGAAPFVIALLIMIAMICVWPDIVMWAPRAVREKNREKR
jgi:TRAP-type mannitol/chloroaromatic compound transport system permease large subunit